MIKRILVLAVGILVAGLMTFGTTETFQPEPPGYETVHVGVEAASADWYFNCRHSRHSHNHYLAEKVHTFKDIAKWNSGGRHYHRGTWVTYDLNAGRYTASDRRTYDCTGAH